MSLWFSLSLIFVNSGNRFSRDWSLSSKGGVLTFSTVLVFLFGDLNRMLALRATVFCNDFVGVGD